MPNRPLDPTDFPNWANEIGARLRAVERRILRKDKIDVLQTFEDGSPLGDTLSINFGSGLRATLVGDREIDVTGSGGGAYTWQSPTSPTVSTGSRFYAERSGGISFVRAERSSGDGTGTATLDVLKNGASIFTSATKPTVAAATFLGAERTPDDTSFVKGDYFQIEIEATGGGTGPLRVTIVLSAG